MQDSKPVVTAISVFQNQRNQMERIRLTQRHRNISPTRLPEDEQTNAPQTDLMQAQPIPGYDSNGFAKQRSTMIGWE